MLNKDNPVVRRIFMLAGMFGFQCAVGGLLMIFLKGYKNWHLFILLFGLIFCGLTWPLLLKWRRAER